MDLSGRELLLDLGRVSRKLEDTGRVSSELDKSDKKRTHMSDALGYYLASAFAGKGTFGERRERLM